MNSTKVPPKNSHNQPQTSQDKKEETILYNPSLSLEENFKLNEIDFEEFKTLYNKWEAECIKEAAIHTDKMVELAEKQSGGNRLTLKKRTNRLRYTVKGGAPVAATLLYVAGTGIATAGASIFAGVAAAKAWAAGTGMVGKGVALCATAGAFTYATAYSYQPMEVS